MWVIWSILSTQTVPTLPVTSFNPFGSTIIQIHCSLRSVVWLSCTVGHMWHILITSQSLRWVEKTSWLPQHRLRTDDLIPPLAYCRIITDTKKMWRSLCLKVIKPKWIVHCVSVSCLLNWSDFWLGWNTLHWTKNSRRRSHWWMSNCQENSVDLARDLSTPTYQVTWSRAASYYHPQPLSQISSTSMCTTQT